MVMGYHSLSELSKEFKVSSSTIRRVYKKIRDGEIKEYKGNPIVKTQLLPNGKSKVFILKEYVDNKVLNPSIQQSITPHSQRPIQPTQKTEPLYTNTNDEFIEVLRNQLNEKDKQIDEFQKSFNHFQELEEKIIVLVNDLKDELSKQNRMLEEKNGEIQRLQSISIYRQSLLEKYTKKEKNYQDKEVREKYTKVEVVDEVELELNTKLERSFLDWIEGND